MANNWSSTLEDRRAGNVPGFIGAGESIEDYEARMAEQPEDATANTPADNADAFAQASQAAADAKPAKKAAAKRSR